MALLRYLALCLILLLIPLSVHAYQVLLVVGSRIAVFEEAITGLRNEKAFSDRMIYLSDYVDIDLQRMIREDRPRVIVAVGDRALQAVRGVRQVPVVSVMAVGLARVNAASPNVTGIEFIAQPERYLSLYSSLQIRRVAIIYDPARSEEYLKRARQTASRFNIELVPRIVKSPWEVFKQLTELSGTVDGLWMIPDASVINRQSIEGFFLFAMAQQIPLVSFSNDHLALGATAVLEPSRYEMGRQAAEMVGELLSGKRAKDIGPIFPRKIQLGINSAILKQLGMTADRLSPTE